MHVSRRTFERMWRGWLVLVAGALLLAVVLSARAAYLAMREHGVVSVDVPPAAPALRDRVVPVVTQEIAAPARGVTGTIALPAVPMSAAAAAAIVSGETGVVAAKPFSMAGIGAVDRGRAMQCLTAAIYYEAASEPDAGQQAVAQVILNRVRHPAFPATVCGVVYQGSERAGCQFSFACDGAMARIPARAAWARASRTAGMALAGYVFAGVGLATHYHTYAVTPAWNRSLVMTDAVGAHFFHRWKGYWGTASAFSQRYRGAEPVPGPHAPALPPVVPEVLAVPVMPVMAATRPVAKAITPVETIQPAYRESGMARTPVPAKEDNLPPESQILDKWKDTGKPLVP